MKKTAKLIVFLFACCFILTQLTNPAWANPGKKDHLPPGLQKQQQKKVQKQEPIKGYTFVDIQEHWAANDIEVLQAKGIMKGYEDKKFQPNKPVTKNEAIAVIMRVVNHQDAPEDMSIAVKNIFPAWMGLAPVQAYDAGIIQDWELAQWNGNKPATRIEVAMWLSRAISDNDTSIQELLTLKDVNQLSKEELIYAALMYKKGIMKGTPSGFLNPFKPITRAEFAAMVLRFVNGENVTPINPDKNKELISRLTPAQATKVDLETRDFEIKFTENMVFTEGKEMSDLPGAVKLWKYENNNWIDADLEYAITFSEGTNKLAIKISNNQTLSPNTKYCISISSGILETNQTEAKQFPGISNGQWAFTTLDGDLSVTEIKATSDTTVELQFNREIQKGDSFETSGDGVHVLKGSTELDVNVLSINNNKLTITIDSDDSFLNTIAYTLWIAPGVIKDFEVSQDDPLEFPYQN